MTIEKRNVQLLKDAYAEWADSKAHSLDCWMDIMSDEVSLRSLPDGAYEMPFTAPRYGREEVRQYLEGLTETWMMVSFDMNEFIAQDDKVVAIGRVAWKHKRTGKLAQSPQVHVWRLKDGLIVELREFFDTALAFAAAAV